MHQAIRNKVISIETIRNEDVDWLLQAQAEVRKEFNEQLQLQHPKMMDQLLTFALESEHQTLSNIYTKIRAAAR